MILDSIFDFLSDFLGSGTTNGLEDFDHSFLAADMSWDSLDAHQKSIANAVDACGIPLDSSKRCLQHVMDAIGADPSDAHFVAQRIDVNMRTKNLLQMADDLIDFAEGLTH